MVIRCTPYLLIIILFVVNLGPTSEWLEHAAAPHHLPSVKVSVSFFQQILDVDPPSEATPCLIVGVGCPSIALMKRNNNLLPILVQCYINLAYAN